MCVELTLVLTIHRLTLSLKLILGEISERSMRRHEKIGLRFIIVFGLAYFTADFSTWWLNRKISEYFTVISLLTVSLLYTIVIVMLNKVMNRI